MKLAENKCVFFEDITHTYTMGGKYLIGVTALMKKHGLSADYANIPEHILETAASHGIAVHESIDHYCKTGEITSEEAQLFKELCFNVIASEYLVSDNKMVASSIDLVFDDFSIGDIKTTYVLHKKALMWQLSIYAYLFEKQNKGLKVPGLFAIHIRGGHAKVVPIDRIPDEEVERLFECERNGELYTKNDAITVVAPYEELAVVERAIVEIKQRAEEAEALRATLLERLYKDMTDNGVDKIENDLMVITRVAPTVKNYVDSKKLYKEYPSIYEEVKKESSVKGYVKIKLKDE